MAGDLPAGKYTVALIGAWWPQPSPALRAGAQQWVTQKQLQEQYAQDLHGQWTVLASANQGHTADDLVFRFQQGEKHHLDLAEKYQVKADSFEKGADAIDSLRDGLRGIADDYNQRIAKVENSKELEPIKVAEVEELIAEANGFAAHKAGAAVAAIMDATQRILTAEGLAMSPQDFLKNQGVGVENPTKGATGGRGAPGVGGAGDGVQRASPSSGSAPVAPLGVGGHMPGAPAVNSPLPGAGGLSPAAALGGPSPSQLGNSFATGIVTSQPAAAGAHQLSEGVMNAVGSPGNPPPQSPVVPPVSAPTMTGGVESAAAQHGSAAATSAGSGAPVASTGGAVPVTPTVVSGGPVSAPMTPLTGSPATPAGPLPAYGSDLRPPVVAAPSMSAPTAPVSGSPVAPSVSTSSSAGSPLMSTVHRTAAGRAGTGPAVPPAASALSAATGAVAGDATRRGAEQHRLQRLVDAVARQAPGLSWAAGLRDDGTTLLVTDIACGWVPPNVKIPVGGNRRLEPALRRSDAGVVDLLGAVTAAAVHQPNGFIAKPRPDDPALTGDRAARSGPEVDELGPTLVEAVRRRDGLPRVAQTLAQAATRGTGVTEKEIDLLQKEQESAYHKAMDDPHDLSRVADWMLLAAIGALIDGHESLAHYHVAWYEAVSAKPR